MREKKLWEWRTLSDRCFVQPPVVSAPTTQQSFISLSRSLTHANWNELCYVFVPQISELSDLADRPLVGALTSRLQALHAQLQAFVERVDNLGKPPAGGMDPQVEGESPLASPCAPLPCSGDGQDGLNTAEEKVNENKHTPPFTSCHSLSLSLIYFQSFFQDFTFCWIFIFCCH